MAVQNIFTTAKLVAVLIVISGGAWKLFQGKLNSPRFVFPTINLLTIFSLQETLNIYQMLLTTRRLQWESSQQLSTLDCGLMMVGTT